VPFSVMLLFPDEGAKKRFAKQLEKAGFPLLFCTKDRLVGLQLIHSDVDN
jgi:hypothetical protein